MIILQDVVVEANLVAEYAGLWSAEFFIVNDTTIGVGDAQYVVDPTWAMGNLKRLPDRCTLRQMKDCLVQSHPDRKGLGPKHPEHVNP
jgi:hypothetical protein